MIALLASLNLEKVHVDIYLAKCCRVYLIYSLSLSLVHAAPKFRNSFVGTMSDLKSSARRPNSIISLSSSTSSGGSSVSSSCIKMSNNLLHHHHHHIGDEPERPTSHCHLRVSSSSSDVQKDKKNLKQEKNVPCKFKYSRSTTVVSQCSTGN